MKKHFVAALVVLLIPALSEADWPSIPPEALTGYSSACVPILGQAGKSVDVYVDNVARTTRQLYERGGGSWVRGGATAAETVNPMGMLFTCESKDVRVGFGGGTPTASTLHKFVAESSWIPISPTLVSEGVWIAGAAADNVHCAMTPLY